MSKDTLKKRLRNVEMQNIKFEKDLEEMTCLANSYKARSERQETSLRKLEKERDDLQAQVERLRRTIKCRDELDADVERALEQVRRAKVIHRGAPVCPCCKSASAWNEEAGTCIDCESKVGENTSIS